MLFVTIGLLILISSFLVALVILVREQGSRSDLDESFGSGFVPRELAEEALPLSRDDFQLSQGEAVQEAEFRQEETDLDDASLKETVSFPWEIEADGQINDLNQTNQGVFKPGEIVLGNSADGGIRNNLSGEVTLSELMGKN